MTFIHLLETSQDPQRSKDAEDKQPEKMPSYPRPK